MPDVHHAIYSPCTINRDGNNRVTSVTVYESDGVTIIENEIPITTMTIVNEDAYNDAYNEYKYETYLYEQRMNEINAQTSAVQEQDRTLELRLKQLDTEHKAVTTEMEAVKSMVDKNVEDSFKTFA